jgi:hypothetical protein
VFHHLLRAIALNFEEANGRMGRFTFQVKCRAELVQSGYGFVKRLLRLFVVDAGEQLNLSHLKLSLAEVAFGLLDLGLVLRTRQVFFSLLLDGLVCQLLICVLLVDQVAHLRLAIEIHKKVALAHRRAARSQSCDGQGTELLTFEHWRDDRAHSYCLGDARQANSITKQNSAMFLSQRCLRRWRSEAPDDSYCHTE